MAQFEKGDSDLPVGVSLAWRMQALIQSGRLPPAEQLPSVRELADGAGVHMNTVRSVYRRLEDQGMTVARHGSGTFVAPYVTVSPTLEELAARVAEEAVSQGIEPRELARALYSGTGPDVLEEPEVADESAARRTLRGQIARLEAALAPYPEAPVEPAGTKRRPPVPRVSGIAELEATRDRLVDRLSAARKEAASRGERDLVARRRFEEAVADPAAHRWEAGQLDELGEPGCGRWQVRPAWGPVGALMNWWRVKISSGCP